MSSSPPASPTEARSALSGMINTGSLGTFQGVKGATVKNVADLKKKGKLGGKSRNRRRSGRSYRRRSTRRRA